MKTHVVLPATFAILLAAVFSYEIWDAEKEQCVTNLNLDNETMRVLYFSQDVAPDNTDYSNFLACYLKTSKFQSERGYLDVSKAAFILEDELIEIFADRANESIYSLEERVIIASIECRRKDFHKKMDGATIARFLNCAKKRMQTELIN